MMYVPSAQSKGKELYYTDPHRKARKNVRSISIMLVIHSQGKGNIRQDLLKLALLGNGRLNVLILGKK